VDGYCGPVGEAALGCDQRQQQFGVEFAHLVLDGNQ
jgi:hypothetical protein